MKFTFKQEITKQFLLEKYSEETYMQYYLGIPVDHKLHCSPLRKDNKPTCGFYRNAKDELIFKDFGSNFSGNFINVVMEKYNTDYYSAIKMIAEDFNLISGNTSKTVAIKEVPKMKKSERSVIQIESKDFTKSELDWWKDFGISKDILDKYCVYSCKHVFLNGNIIAQSAQHCPIYGYFLGKEGKDELWRLYFPQRKSYRFLSNTSSKKIQGFKQLPKSGKVVVITKSMKDCMCLYSFGIPACAPNSETLSLSDNALNNLKERFKYIIYLYDNDYAGIINLNKIKKEHPELLYTWIPRRYGAKDISDFYKNNGRTKTLQLLKQFFKWLETRKS